MRWLVVVVLLTSRLAVAEPTLDEAIAHAAQANKPLVVELYAEWCGPCHDFEEKVLPRPDVKRALATIEFVRYDVDRPIGGYVEARFGTSGVPAFLVFDGTGKEIGRHLGGYSPNQFLDLIARITDAQTLTSRLDADRRPGPREEARPRPHARARREASRSHPRFVIRYRCTSRDRDEPHSCCT